MLVQLLFFRFQVSEDAVVFLGKVLSSWTNGQSDYVKRKHWREKTERLKDEEKGGKGTIREKRKKEERTRERERENKGKNNEEKKEKINQ